MQSNDNAPRKLWELIHSEHVSRKGPFLMFADPALSQEAAELLETALGAIEQIDSGTRRAPTPWHAAIWLQNVMLGIGERRLTYTADSPDGARPLGAPLFRGQGSLAWKLTPSIFRAETIEHAYVALARFVLALSLLIRTEELPALGSEVLIATAQHYGLRTPYLDFTVDPFIAVSFACHTSPQDGQDAVVHWMPFEIAASLGLQIIIPPPWVKTLYKERGLFLGFSDEREIDGYCERVIFPADKTFPRLAFGTIGDELSATDLWFVNAGHWAQTSSLALPTTQEEAPAVAGALAHELIETVGSPRFVIDALFPEMHKKWFEFFVEIFEWTSLKRKGEEFEVDCAPLKAIRNSNHSFIQGIQLTLDYINREMLPFLPISQEGIGPYIFQIRDCLNEPS